VGSDVEVTQAYGYYELPLIKWKNLILLNNVLLLADLKQVGSWRNTRIVDGKLNVFFKSSCL
jgi:hypothetical protein